MDGCTSLSNTFLNDSAFDITTATSNKGKLPLFTVDRCGLQFDGTYIVGGDSSRDLVTKARSLCFSADGYVIHRVTYGGAWPNTVTLPLPPVLLQKISHFPTNTAAFGAANATITIKDSSNTEVWSKEYIMNNVGSPTEDLINLKLTWPDDYITIEFSSTYTGGTPVPFQGALFLTY
jgi:hypothetical protein